MSAAVRLAWYEVAVAEFVGLLRYLQVEREHLRPTYGERVEGGNDRSMIGACGEAAVAKALDRYWPMTVGTFRELADIGDDIEVRHTTRTNGRLITHPEEDPSRVFVLVTGSSPSFVVRGWMRGGDTMRAEFSTELVPGRGPVFAVPQEALCTDLGPLRSR